MEGELELILAHPVPDGAPANVVRAQAAKDFVAGAVAGMAGVVAGQPLDTLRIRLQQRGGGARGVAAIARAEGVRGLFRGMSYPLYTTALQNAVTFQAQRAGERALSAAGALPGLAATCAAGMFAGAVQTFISSPVELLKIRLQLQREVPGSAGYVGPLAMLRRVLRDEGAPGLFRGCGITLMRDTPSYGLYFVAYALFCSGLDTLGARIAAATPLPLASASATSGSSGGGGDGGGGGGGGEGSSSAPLGCGGEGGGGCASSSSGSSSAAVQFFAGGLAGMLAWLSVYPLDVVKSRIQALPAAASPYTGAWHCATASAREEGLAVFAKGLSPTLQRAFIVNSAIFACFEACCSAMG